MIKSCNYLKIYYYKYNYTIFAIPTSIDAGLSNFVLSRMDIIEGIYSG